MTSLFKDSIIFLYIFSCIVVINYGKFKDYQKVSLFYLTNLGMTYTGMMGARHSSLLLVLMLYLYEEFFQIDDADKNKVITNWVYKICDFAYLSICKDYVLWMILALFMESYTIKMYFGEWEWLATIISFVFFLVCLHKLYGQKYQLKTVSEMFTAFNSNAGVKLPLNNEQVRKIFGLITTIEDKSFFIRQKSYSWCSIEFIKYRFSRLRNEKKGKREKYHRRIDLLFLLKHPGTTLIKCYKVLCQSFESIKCFIVKIKKMRGFSTLEMQYIRTIGVETGKDEFKLRRKIFEIIYTKIFFCSVRNYYKRNKYAKEKNFKEYMLYQYMQVAFTKINGIPFEHLAEAFESSDMAEWDIDSVAVAVLGMNGNGIYTERLKLRFER